MRACHVALLLLAAAAWRAVGVPDPKARGPGAPCSFHLYKTQNVSSWEFQLDLPADRFQGRRRPLVLATVAAALTNLTQDPGLEVRLELESLRTSVFTQRATAVSTLDGRPLYRGQGTPPGRRYDWSEIGILRRRQKLAMYHGEDGRSKPDEDLVGLGTSPGDADLTLKLKNLRDSFPDSMHELVGARGEVQRLDGKMSTLKHKLENDVYCNFNRATYSANFHPVEFGVDISTPDGVGRYFPNLTSYLQIPARFPLPPYNTRHFSKSVWDIEVGGVGGVMDVNLIYDTTLDALTGGQAIQAELSMRLKREHIEARRGDGVAAPLDALAALFQRLHALGWDTGEH